MATKSKQSTAARQGSKQRMSFKEYRTSINEAYKSGYRDGWAAHEHIPQVKGARYAAQAGYSKGLKNHKKADKYKNKAR